MSTLGKSINISENLNSNAVQVISQWIGSSNVIRNQKINEFKQNLQDKKDLSQSYSNIRTNKDLSFLKEISVQILRNSASDVFSDVEASKKGIRSFPKFKKRNCSLTKELFFIENMG